MAEGTVANAARPPLLSRIWSFFQDEITAVTTAELSARQIHAIVLKGPGFARLLYDEDERCYTDTDLLVKEADRSRAEQALAELGFARVDGDRDWLGPAPQYAHTFRRPGDGAAIDLHWRLSGAAASPDELWQTICEHTTQIEVAGRRVDVLTAPASAFLVALHNAHHGTGRPKTMTDLDRAVARLPLPVWKEATSLADRLGASEPFATGLRLTEAGDALASSLRLAQPRSVEMWLRTHSHEHAVWALDRAAQARSLRARLRIVVRVVVPTRRAMCKFSPLARRSTAGLWLAYVLRPFGLLSRAGPALHQWHHARRAVATRYRARVPHEPE